VPSRPDRRGERYGRWTIIANAPSRKRQTAWRCRCDCGNVRDVFWTNLTAGTSLSCGCTTRKLTPEQVKAIKADTRTQKRIARAYGVAQSVISNVKTKRSSIPNDRYRPRSSCPILSSPLQRKDP